MNDCKMEAFKTMELCPPSRRPWAGAEGYDLDDVYKCCSKAKRRAWDYVERLCFALEGTGLAVSSHNTFSFSARFFFYHPENGRAMMAVITPSHNWCWYED